MTYNEILALALSNTHTKAGQVSSTILNNAFNIARNRLGKEIVQNVGENYFFQIWKRDAIANQDNGEYPYPEADQDSAGADKITGVAIKGLTSDVYYRPCREVDVKNLEHDWEWYLVNQPKSDPIYFIADESIFIAPQFSASDLPANPSGNLQIKLTGIAKLIDLTTGASAASILIPTDQHHRIAIGMEEYIYKSRKMKTEAVTAMQEFDLECQKMIDELTNRNNSNMQASVPNDFALGFGE